jgi:hypothetical protein
MLAIPSPFVRNLRYISTVDIPCVVEKDLGRLSGVRVLSGLAILQDGSGHLQRPSQETKKCHPHFAVNWIGADSGSHQSFILLEFQLE